MAAGGRVRALLQLCVERLDYLVLLLELLTQPAHTHTEIMKYDMLLVATKRIKMFLPSHNECVTLMLLILSLHEKSYM